VSGRPETFPVPPGCVYVWRGYMTRSPSGYQADYDKFAAFLGGVFVPGCALLQPKVGLRAYLPTMVPHDASVNVPDQTALMFWATPTAHDLAAKATAVRIYQNLHGDAYDMTRSKTPEVPVSIATTKGTLQPEQPYYLLDGPADWMLGSVHHLVGARPAQQPADFLTRACKWATDFHAKPPTGIDGALLCCGNDYVVAWVHGSADRADLSAALAGLAASCRPVLQTSPTSKSLPAGLWNDWPGLDLKANGSLNLQFARPMQTAPVQPGNRVKEIQHFEVPHLALWKSCVAEVLARASRESDTTACGVDTDHPMMRGTDRYCRSMLDTVPLAEPDANSSDEGAVQAWLSYLHHRRAHARIGEDAKLEADIARQTQEFKYGNPLWQDMFVQYYKYYWQYPYHLAQKPQYRSWRAPEDGNGDLQYGVIDWRLPADARIVVVGDIGTGTDVAAAVLTAALKFVPDAILHVGDIYFSGTKFETERRLVGLVRAVRNSLGSDVPFFTVPGNHEYFTGAGSYLEALDSGELVTHPSQRQRASYFCLRTADNGWQFLGLDTGYNGHYMNVAKQAQQATLDRLHIGKILTASDTSDPHWPADRNPYFCKASGASLPKEDSTAPIDMVTLRPDEAAWHRDKLAGFPGRSILLSHHQLYSALDPCGPAQKQLSGTTTPDPADFNRAWINTGLWRQLGSAFGDKVAGWIWGHEHNLGIFQDNYRPSDWPTNSDDAQQIFKALPKGRCAGHSAIPVQESEVPYKQVYPVPLKAPELTLGLTDGWYNRGFQLIELSGADKPARVTYFEVSGADPVPLPIFVEQFK